MAEYSGRIGIADLSPELRALIEELVANSGKCNGDCNCGGGVVTPPPDDEDPPGDGTPPGEDGGGDGTDIFGGSVIIGDTQPEDLPVGAFWLKTTNFTPPKNKDINFVLSEDVPEEIGEGDVWVQVVDKGLGTTVFVMSNATFGKKEPEKTNIWLDPINT